MARKARTNQPMSTIPSSEKRVEPHMDVSVRTSKTLQRMDSFAIKASTDESGMEVVVATVNTVTVTVVPSISKGTDDSALVNLNVTSATFRTDSPITLVLRFLDSNGFKLLEKRLLFNVQASPKAVHYAAKTDIKSGSLDAAVGFLVNVRGGIWVHA